MESKLKGMIRPTLALLLIGVIVGLIFLYYSIDEDVSADDSMGSEELVKPEEDKPNNTTPDTNDGDSNVVEPPKVEPIPRRAVNGVLTLGGRGETRIVKVENFMRGYILVGDTTSREGDFKTEGKSAIALAYIEDDALMKTYVIKEDEDVKVMDAVVGPFGLAIVATSNLDVYLYRVSFDMKLLDRRVIENVDKNSVNLVYSDSFVLSYKQGTKLSIDTYDNRFLNNNLLCLDNNEELKGMYIARDGSFYLAFDSGSIVHATASRVIDVKSIGYSIEDIKPIMLEGKIAYAVIGYNDITKRLLILDESFNIVRNEYTSGEEIIYVDRMYTLNRRDGVIDIYCHCGEFSMSENVNIDEITYIDYEGSRLAYMSNGECVLATMDNGVKAKANIKGVIVYLSEEFDVINSEKVTIQYRNKSIPSI